MEVDQPLLGYEADIIRAIHVQHLVPALSVIIIIDLEGFFLLILGKGQRTDLRCITLESHLSQLCRIGGSRPCLENRYPKLGDTFGDG